LRFVGQQVDGLNYNAGAAARPRSGVDRKRFAFANVVGEKPYRLPSGGHPAEEIEPSRPRKLPRTDQCREHRVKIECQRLMTLARRRCGLPQRLVSRASPAPR
jgi:hypothetical protein